MVQNPSRRCARKSTKSQPDVINGHHAHAHAQGDDSNGFNMADCWNDDTADAFGRVLEAHGLNDVKAFALLTLHNGNDIAVRTSKNVKQFANGVAPKHLRQHFRQLYEEATSAPTDRQASSSSEGSTESVDSKRKFAVRTIQPRSEQVSGSVPPSSQPPTANHQQQTTGRRGREATRDLFDRRLSDMMPVVHLRLGDTAQVKLQLEHRLRNLHQIPVKKIAKAWIKAICPKKQARFPYQNCAYEKVTGQSPPRPEWWPPVSVCAYKEPDHIHRDQRVPLCLHLLRLRPTPEQLKEWNKDQPGSEPHPTHAKFGWTAFLKEHAFTQVMEDLRGSSPEHTARRVKILEEMYEIAEREESALSADPGYDLSHVFVVEDAAAKSRKKEMLKRKRLMAVSNTSELAPVESRSSSVATRFKKRKTGSERPAVVDDADDNSDDDDAEMVNEKPATTHIIEPLDVDMNSVCVDPTSTHPEQVCAVHNAVAHAEDDLSYSQALTHASSFPVDSRTQQPLQHALPSEHATYQRSNFGYINNPSSWIEDVSPNTSFNSSGSSESSFEPTSSFDYPQCSAFRNTSHRQDMHVNYMDQPSQPQWDTVPNTPICSPGTLMQLPYYQTPDLDGPTNYNNDNTNTNHMPQLPQLPQRTPSFIDPSHLQPPSSLKYEPHHHQSAHQQQPYTSVLPFDPATQGYTHASFYLHHNNNSASSKAHATSNGLPALYPDDSRPQTEVFQAPARVMRPFTGYCSGVGGGACECLPSRAS